MEKKPIALVFVALLVGLGGGYGLGYMVYQPQVLGFQSNLEKIETDLLGFRSDLGKIETDLDDLARAPTAYTSISLGQKFNWSIAEIVGIQQDYYVYSGHDISSVYWQYLGDKPSVGTIYLAKWLNGWVELRYKDGFPQNVTLSPYTLQIYGYGNNYLTGKFLEA